MNTPTAAIILLALCWPAVAQLPPPPSDRERETVNVAPAKPLPKDVSEALAAATTFTLYSLDPAGGAKPGVTGTFRGWRILGQTQITDAAARKQIASTIADSVAQTGGLGAKCFEPHHGLRFTAEERTYELVICFMCGHLNIYTTGSADRYARVSTGAEILDSILVAAKVPMADRMK